MLLVGTYHGIKGKYCTIQSAVDAAKPGAWILVGPGVYHETNDLDHPPTQAEVDLGDFGGVLIEKDKANLHIRGMDRNTTIVDGDKPGSSTPCDPSEQYQNYGAKNAQGKYIGRNGITAFEVDNVWIENLTVCNFLAGVAGKGFQIWWDGGEGSGKINMHGYWGNYLTATSTFYKPPPKNGIDTNATYGLYANSADGPAKWDHVYASNMNDSGAYIGACQQCDATIDNSWFEYNPQGYSGTNSGGSIIIQNSEFDHNMTGAATDIQVSADPPPIQDGACASGKTSPITGSTSCWVFMNNNVHDNNNADVPAAGSAAGVPVGTGMTISGGRNDTVTKNTFSNNGAWGVAFLPFADNGKPWGGKTCADYGGVQNPMGLPYCILPSWGNALIGNTFTDNGAFGNPNDGDYGELRIVAGEPQNCFSKNMDGTAPASSTPTGLEQTEPTCDGTKTTSTELTMFEDIICDGHIMDQCATGLNYPKLTPTKVTMRPLPKDLPSMPDPCKDVPKNPWCP